VRGQSTFVASEVLSKDYRIAPIKIEPRVPVRGLKLDNMEKMRQWLTKRGFQLQLLRGAEDCVDFAARTVCINSESTYQIKLSSLIHECGHVRIFLSRVRRPGSRICGSTLAEQCLLVGRREPRARSSRISLLQEEMDAWESGEELAKGLAVRYNRCVFEKDRVRALMTYVAYTAGRMRMCETEQNVRRNLESTFEGLVKLEMAKAKRKSVVSRKELKIKKRHFV